MNKLEIKKNEIIKDLMDRFDVDKTTATNIFNMILEIVVSLEEENE